MAYHSKSVHAIGWTMVVLGSIGIILGVAAVATFASRGDPTGTSFHYYSGPIWSGIFVLVTGILGVVSGRKAKSKGLIVAFMVMGIFSIILAFTCFGLAITGAFVDRCYIDPSYYHDYFFNDGYPKDYVFTPDYYDDIIPSNRTRPMPAYSQSDVDDSGRQKRLSIYPYDDSCTMASQALHGVSAFLAFVELVLGFVVSIMCCCGLCSNTTPNVIYGPGALPGQVISNGQGGFILLQTVPHQQHFGPHQQVFIAQQPHGGPMGHQVFYTSQQAASQATKAPPLDTKTPLTV